MAMAVLPPPPLFLQQIPVAAGYFPPPVLRNFPNGFFQPAAFFPPPAGFGDSFFQPPGSKDTTLIGKLLGKKKKALRVEGVWELDGAVYVTSLGDGFYEISFALKGDFTKVWSQGTVAVGEDLLLLRRWCPAFHLDIKNMCYAQVWIQVSGLNRCYWKKEILRKMASSAGQPIEVDIQGDDQARVRVEVDVNKPLVTGVPVDGGKGGFWQCFRYEIPGLCFNCGRLSHKREYCPYPRQSKLEAYGSHSLAPMKEHEHKHPRLRYFCWHRPEEGWMKLNFDGSFKGKTGKGGGGGVVRDSRGCFLAAIAAPLPEACGSLEAEIGALEAGLKLALNLNLNAEHILIEGDSKIAIEMLTGKREVKGGEEKRMMDGIRELLQGFRKVEARHEFREANMCADHLANIGVQIQEAKEWYHQPPHSLLPLLLHDQLSRVVPRLVL